MLTDFAPFRAPELDALAWFDSDLASDPAASGTTPVSNSLGIQYESLANAAANQAVIDELLASLSLSRVAQYEANQGLSPTAIVIAEALGGIAGSPVIQDEASGLIAGANTVRDESLASLTQGQAVQGETLQGLAPTSLIADESLATALAAPTARDESLSAALAALVVQYEAGGIVSTPVSNSVVVILEALASIAQSQVVQFAAGQQLTVASVIPQESTGLIAAPLTARTESLASLTVSASVLTEAKAAVVALLITIFEAGGLGPGSPMLGINSIVFGVMVTLAALDLLTTSIATDVNTTTAPIDSLTTSIVTDSLTTRSVFDG